MAMQTRATRTPIVDTPKSETTVTTPVETPKEAESTASPAVWEAFAEGSDIENELNKAGEELLAYVDKQIQRMNNKVNFSSGDVSLYELDVALSTYEPTLFALTAVYYYDKYMEIRNRYNTIDVKTAQWLSSKEIDATLFKTYRKEAAKLKAEMIKAEGQRSTVERLLKGWENYAYILGQLSKNINAQMMGSSIGVDIRRSDDVLQGT